MFSYIFSINFRLSNSYKLLFVGAKVATAALLLGFVALWSRSRDATPAVGNGDGSAGKVNTPFCQDGPAPCVSIGTFGVVFSLPNCCVGCRTACNSHRSAEDAWITGDERHRMYSYAIFTFCLVCCDASNS